MPNPRKPQRLKKIEGTYRKDREPDTVEMPDPETLDAPDWLSGPDAANEWERLTGLLDGAHLLTEADLTALGHLCNLHGRCVRLWRAGESPTAAELTQLRLYFKEFCLTPNSRKVDPDTEGKGGNNDPAEAHFTGPRVVNE